MLRAPIPLFANGEFRGLKSFKLESQKQERYYLILTNFIPRIFK